MSMMKQKSVKNEAYFSRQYGLLRQVLGDPEVLHQMSPLFYCESALEILIATILTQATADRNALQAWRNFKVVYNDLNQVLQREPATLYQTIRVGGMAVQKGNTIIRVLQAVMKRWGLLSLDELKKRPDDAWNFLNQLPGVGPKTAACTMLFGLEIPCFPVDTHIERIAKRQGWVAKTLRPGDIQQQLVAVIPQHLLADLHILLLNLGREFCRPQHPRCDQCPIAEDCNFNG